MELLDRIGPLITKQDIHFRSALPAGLYPMLPGYWGHVQVTGVFLLRVTHNHLHLCAPGVPSHHRHSEFHRDSKQIPSRCATERGTRSV